MPSSSGLQPDGRGRPSPHEPSLRGGFFEWWRDRRTRNGFLPALGALSAELWNFLRDSTPARERQRYGDMDYDWENHVDTKSAAIGWRNRLLGVFHSPYQPTEPSLFHEMIDSLQIDHAQFTFIDLGSGKGRTLLLATEYPFRRILGVELLPELNHLAQKNIHEFKSETRKCDSVESLCADAREFEFPAGPLLIYLFNPFLESGLAQVVSNLEQSLQAHPRPVVVLYHNPLLANVLNASRLLKKTSRTHQYSVYRNA